MKQSNGKLFTRYKNCELLVNTTLLNSFKQTRIDKLRETGGQFLELKSIDCLIDQSGVTFYETATMISL